MRYRQEDGETRHCDLHASEQVFDNQPGIKRMNKGHFRGEDVYRALGQTDAGRYLVVFHSQVDPRGLILSARDIDDKERKSYAR